MKKLLRVIYAEGTMNLKVSPSSIRVIGLNRSVLSSYNKFLDIFKVLDISINFIWGHPKSIIEVFFSNSLFWTPVDSCEIYTHIFWRLDLTIKHIDMNTHTFNFNGPLIEMNLTIQPVWHF